LKISFVVDGGRDLGMGHIQQSTSMANRLRVRADITFLTKSNEAVLAAIRNAGFPATRFESDVQILRELITLDPDIVIFDKIDVDEGLAIEIKKQMRAALVIFTNLTQANRHADLAITADIGSRFKNQCFTDERTNTRYYFGPKYWVLRPEFYEYKRGGKTPSKNPERVLLIFGGSDPANLTSAVLWQILAMKRTFQIDVVLGAQYYHDASLQQVLGDFPEKVASVAIYKDVRNVAELMFRADLTIASPGLSAFETLCVGTPLIVVPHNDLQRDTYNGFMRVLDKHDLAKLEGMIARVEFTYPNEAHIAAMEIGKGVHELIDAILHLPKNKGKQ
jgi:spore coat polysaccharide biosynthesis predicted glycosyltransferase SpsG